MSDVTRILSQIEQGDRNAAADLLPLVYDELRQLAAARLAHEKPGQTLQATALVHEAYVRLVDTERIQHWNSRGHFFGAAAEAMRRILVEQARQKKSLKGGGALNRVDLVISDLQQRAADVDLLVLDEAIERLEAIDERAARVVKLRFFGGLTVRQAANGLGISVATAENDWTYAKIWLQRELGQSDGSDAG